MWGVGPPRPGRSPGLLCRSRFILPLTEVEAARPGVRQNPACGHTGCAHGKWKGCWGPLQLFSAAAEETGVPGFSSVLTHFVPRRSLLQSPHLQSEEVRLDAYEAPNLHIYQEAGREERAPPQPLTCLEF